jgi:hypothetical protein
MELAAARGSGGFGLDGLLTFGLALAFLVLPAIWALSMRDAARSKRGIEAAKYGTHYGRPGMFADRAHQTLWERLESGSERRGAKIYVLVGIGFVSLIAWVVAGGARNDPSAWSLLPEIGIIIVLTLIFGPRALLRRDKETDADCVHAVQVPSGALPEIEEALAQMTLAAGIRTPGLYVVEIDSVNAIVFDGGALCLTRGLLQRLCPDECKAVFAWLLGRQSDPDLVGSEIDAFASDGAEVTDAEALRLLRDPAPMLAAWKKVLAAGNAVPGSKKLSAARFLVPPGESGGWRESRLRQLTQLAHAEGLDPRARLMRRSE